jgi:hypothetical protein
MMEFQIGANTLRTQSSMRGAIAPKNKVFLPEFPLMHVSVLRTPVRTRGLA